MSEVREFTVRELVIQSTLIHPDWSVNDHIEWLHWEGYTIEGHFTSRANAEISIARWIDSVKASDTAEATGPCASGHLWVAGMCYVADEDVSEVAKTRSVECERCETKYAER